MSEEQKARDRPELEKAIAYYINELKHPEENVFGQDKTLEAMCNVKARLDALKGGKRKSRRSKKSKGKKSRGKKSKGRKSRTGRKTKHRR